MYDVQSVCFFAENGGCKVEQKASYGDALMKERMDRVEDRLAGVEKRLSLVEGSQMSVVHGMDEMRAENNSQFAELRKMLTTVIEEQHIIVAIVRSLQQPPPTDQ